MTSPSERTDLGAALHDLGIALNQINTFIKNEHDQVAHRP